MHILFMDDDTDRYDRLRKKLPEAIKITHCSDALTTMEAIRTNEYDLVMLDHDLGYGAPGGDGIEVAKWLSRSRDEYKWKSGCTVIVHSLNPVGAGNMISELGRSSITADYIPGAWTRIECRLNCLVITPSW